MKMKSSYLYTLILAVIFHFLTSQTPLVYAESQEKTPLHIAQQLRQHLAELSSLSFNFSQRTRGQLSGRSRQATGQAFFIKDSDGAKMRWDYQAPERQVIISDGNELTMYFENLNQMIIAPADSLQQDVTYSFFTSKQSIEEDFLVSPGIDSSEAGDSLADFDVIKLSPKSPTSQIKFIRMWITNITQIKRIEIHDTFDTITLLNLSNIEENALNAKDPEQNEVFFSFNPPEGTEIIRQ